MFISIVDTNTNKYLLVKKTFGSVNNVTIGREKNNFVLKYTLVTEVDTYEGINTANIWAGGVHVCK
jgi:hypothetical protein